MPRKTIVFAPETFNLAEVTRLVEIARVATRSFDCVFISYDAEKRNHGHIERAGFAVRSLEPAMTPEKIARFWAVDRGDELGDIISVDDIRARVSSEMALFRELSPVAVVTGFCLSTPISARAARVPLVWVSQGTWLPEYAERFARWPDAFDTALSRLAPEALLDGVARRMTRTLGRVLSRPFDRVARERGVAPFGGHALLEGDHNLFAEPPGFSGIEVPARLDGRHRFIGPLPARLDVPVPEAVRSMPRDRPIVYLAMGSSGRDDTVAKLIASFADKPYRVIAPVQALLEGPVDIPDNVLVTGWVPALEVNGMCDVAVIHGGIGTVMTALLSATPVVGIPNGLVEQEYNLDAVERLGLGVRLRLRRFDAGDVVASVERMLADQAMKQRARAYREVLAAMSGPELATRFFEETFGS